MELIDWGPWALSAIIVPQVWYMHHKKALGWVYSFIGCICYIIYNSLTEQWGFVPINILFAVLAVGSYRKWRNDDHLDHLLREPQSSDGAHLCSMCGAESGPRTAP